MAENHIFKGVNFDKDGNVIREEKPKEQEKDLYSDENLAKMRENVRIQREKPATFEDIASVFFCTEKEEE